MAAGPGGKDYGVLSLMCRYYGTTRLKFIIPRGAFRPVPRVDSACVHINIHKSPPVQVISQEALFKSIKTAFMHRRKTLSNSLKGLIDADSIRSVGIDPQRRPETLSLEEFAVIADNIEESG